MYLEGVVFRRCMHVYVLYCAEYSLYSVFGVHSLSIAACWLKCQNYHVFGVLCIVQLLPQYIVTNTCNRRTRIKGQTILQRCLIQSKWKTRRTSEHSQSIMCHFFFFLLNQCRNNRAAYMRHYDVLKQKELFKWHFAFYTGTFRTVYTI